MLFNCMCVQSASYAVFSPSNFIKKETLVQVFSCEFGEISKNTFFTEHPWATASESNYWQFCMEMLHFQFCYFHRKNGTLVFKKGFVFKSKY